MTDILYLLAMMMTIMMMMNVQSYFVLFFVSTRHRDADATALVMSADVRLPL